MQDERISCLSCGSLDGLNICPKCGLAYCCVKCYRSKGHRECSEKFYLECIEQELRLKNGAQKSPKTFEEFMNEQLEDFPMDEKVAGSCSQILDSDDDDVDDNYLEKVKDGCISEYQSAEERELDRQLTLLGIGTDNGSLLSSLTDQEKKTFTLFYDKLLAQEAVMVITLLGSCKLFLRQTSTVESCKLLFKQASGAVKAEIVDTHKVEKVVDAVEQEWKQKNVRLFAVVYIDKRQFRVSENDLIVLYDNVPLDVGDKIKLEKVLAVGGKNFTLFGRPLIHSPTVTVNAAVVEKTTSYPQLRYLMINHAKVRTLHWMSRETTILRINDIKIDRENM
uniref:Large ribosomal subunit protein bL21m n=1 Tax=Onchocerca volvulus TaxID=6282 RepID=A0A8R1Y4H1_ONCVO